MSLRLLLDEDSQDKLLVTQLKQAGHDVYTAVDLGLGGQIDLNVLTTATNENRILITSNCRDFTALAKEMDIQDKDYAGILLIRRYNNPKKDMTYKDISNALARLEDYLQQTKTVLRKKVISLIDFHYPAPQAGS